MKSPGLVGFFLLAVLTVAFAAEPSWPVLMPELGKLPAPAWVGEGVRLTFTAATANVGVAWDEQGGSGAGWTQVDVVALDDASSVLLVQSVSGGAGGMPVLPIGSRGAVALPASGAEFWLHPDALKKAPERNGDGLTIVAAPFTLGERKFDAMRFQYDAPNTRAVWMYDLATGLLLAVNRRVGPEEGRRNLTDSQWVSTRKVTVPWAAEAVPAWVAKATAIRGEGTTGSVMPGAPTLTLPLRVQGTVTGRGERWLRYDATTTVTNSSGLPPTTSSTTIVCGNAQIGGLWIPPKGAAALKAGQELDLDPTTDFRRFVAGVEGGYLDLREVGPAHQLDTIYEIATGKLVRMRRATKVGIATQVSDLAITVE